MDILCVQIDIDMDIDVNVNIEYQIQMQMSIQRTDKDVYVYVDGVDPHNLRFEIRGFAQSISVHVVKCKTQVHPHSVHTLHTLTHHKSLISLGSTPSISTYVCQIHIYIDVYKLMFIRIYISVFICIHTSISISICDPLRFHTKNCYGISS